MRGRGGLAGVAVAALALMGAACGAWEDQTADGADTAAATSAAAGADTTAAVAVQETAPTTTARTAPATTTAAVSTTTTAAAEPAEGCVPTGTRIGSPETITSGGNTYEYLIHVPASAVAPAPLVLNFHGLGGDGPSHAEYTGYAELADAEGFVVAHPSGLPWDLAYGPRNWEPPGYPGPRDDVGFVRDLLDFLGAQGCIDPSRVYTTGFSNGGFFSGDLVCALADRIAAAVPVGGLRHADNCEPSRPVPMAAIHGVEDDVVPFDGDGESVLLDAVDDQTEAVLKDFVTLVIPDELAKYAADFNCTDSADSQLGQHTTLTTYTGCDEGVEMRFYAVEELAHTWPGTRWAKSTDKTADVLGVNATSDGWAFMRQYSLGN